MKVFKIVVGIVAALIALVIVLAGIALIPAVQSWALRKAVAGQPGLKIEFARVAAGPSSARIEGLRVAKDGMVVSARNADARYSAWDFLFHHRISVDDLTVTDLVLDLRHPTQTGATAPSPTHSGPQPAVSGPKQPGSTFNGILSQITLPYSVQIARFSVPGRVLLPGEQTLTFELRGNDISTGRRGTIDWRADLTNPERNAAFSSLHSSGTVNLHITTEQRIDEAEFHALASAVGPKLPTEQLKLEAKAEQPAEGGNEGYSAVVSIVRDSASAPLITLAAQFAPATHAISGAWEVSIHNEQLADLLTGFGLPNLAATGAGKFGANPGTNAITASGEIQADVSHLEKISPNLAPVGTLHLQSRFNGGMADNTVQLAQIELTATASDGRQLADLRTLQPIGFSLGSKRVTLPNPNAELARVSVQSLPVAWAQPFVKPLQIVSGDLSLALAVASNADGSQVRLTSVDPVFVRNLTVRNGSEPMFDQLTVRVKPQVNYSAGKIHAQLTDLNASMPTGDDVTGTMTADITPANGQPTIAFTADTRAKVVAALKPYLPPEAAPMIVSASSSGTMRGDQLRFDRSDVTVTRESGASVLKFALLQPLTVDTKNNTFQGSNSHTATARVQFGEVPLSWAARVVKNGALAGNLAGGTVDLTLRTATDIAATTTQPIRFQNVSATLAGQPQLDSIDASV
ncbi:MAG TPA: hypothetical protein VHE61_17380, partial [Opitutaceae bacterium]|nr:hypothetical protein [Opitutaceae bacterium]